MVDLGTTNVLVADDEPSTRAMVARHLRSIGYKVIEAVDGDEAISLALEHLPDIVVLDVMMPGMSGWEVCRRIRETVSLAHTGVVMLTGIGESLNEITSPLYGADAHLDKPFEFSVLDATIAETLERRRDHVGRPDGADVEIVQTMGVADEDEEDEAPAEKPKRSRRSATANDGATKASNGGKRKVDKKPVDEFADDDDESDSDLGSNDYEYSTTDDEDSTETEDESPDSEAPRKSKGTGGKKFVSGKAKPVKATKKPSKKRRAALDVDETEDFDLDAMNEPDEAPAAKPKRTAKAEKAPKKAAKAAKPAKAPKKAAKAAKPAKAPKKAAKAAKPAKASQAPKAQKAAKTAKTAQKPAKAPKPAKGGGKRKPTPTLKAGKAAPKKQPAKQTKATGKTVGAKKAASAPKSKRSAKKAAPKTVEKKTTAKKTAPVKPAKKGATGKRAPQTATKKPKSRKGKR